MNRVFEFSPCNAESNVVGFDKMRTELLSVRFGITSALKKLLSSSNGTQANAQISLNE